MSRLLAQLLPSVPWIVIVYALAYIAGGIYALEQRVARVRDQFPNRTLLARLAGYAALAIGLLAAVSIGGHLLRPERDYHLGALVATGAGLAFWICQFAEQQTVIERVRDALLAGVCACIATLTGLWISAL